MQLTLEVGNAKLLPLSWLTVRDLVSRGAARLRDVTLEVNRSTNLAEYTTFWMVGPYQRIARTYEIDVQRARLSPLWPSAAVTGDGFGFFNRGAVVAPRSKT